MPFSNPTPSQRRQIEERLQANNLFGQDPFNIAGGFDIAGLNLEAQRLALESELARQEFGRSLLQQVMDVQRDPFSIVPALQGFSAAGGGTLAPAQDFAQTGGRPADPIFGQLVQQLLQGAGQFAPGGQGAPTAPSELQKLISGFGKQPSAINTGKTVSTQDIFKKIQAGGTL
ncbi:hypothetical protein LCGC14_0410320 [marine sediment metagenome]|uniref:Uncharacterized protein n=1 Tax=marine sediment metagenome TaxID=412755 RepID=A0A0F9W396_9ZZZZ